MAAAETQKDPQAANFVNLHLHGQHSVLDSIIRTDKLPEYIASQGMTACALTDHGTMAGTWSFYKACRAAKIKPILGMEAYYTVGDRTAKEDSDGARYYHLILLAQNGVGLKNLMVLSTKAYTEGMYFKPRLDDSLLAQYGEGLIATTACLGSRSSKLIMMGRQNDAEKLIDHHAAMFKDRFFVELQPSSQDEQILVNEILIDYAKRRNLPLIVTADSHYTREIDKLLHEQTLCIQTNSSFTNPKRFSFGDLEVPAATHDWIWSRSRAHNIPYEAVTNTVALTNLIQDQEYFSDLKNKYPGFKDLEGIPSWQYLERLCKKRLTEKFGGLPPKEYRDRINSELLVIKKMGFSDYILIVEQFLRAGRERGAIVGPGRGSAAGSLVTYSLGITNIDPIKYGLIFERFLNIGRSSTPIVLDPTTKQLITNS